ncbi:polysaccharide deacetylase family protein [Emticicia aquatica]|nr:polysaccharide deacetylase family protein [Emticicia aquatica]
MFLHKTNFVMRTLYPNFVWRKSPHEKKIYLTFDDGPIPEITEFVLETLAKYEAKATFFCIGDNISKHPAIFQKLIDEGHSIGNHTFNHLKGWANEDEVYLKNVAKCADEILRRNHKTQLFRPPYGRIKRSQAQILRPNYDIIMWDVLSGDFSQNLSPERVLKKTIQYTEAGSIVLFHDSIKANTNMSYALPRFLEHFLAEGFQFSKL